MRNFNVVDFCCRIHLQNLCTVAQPGTFPSKKDSTYVTRVT